FNEGKFEEALQLATKFESLKDRTIDDIHYCRYLKAYILLYMGKLQESLKIAEQDYEENRKHRRSLFLIDSIFVKWSNLFFLARVGETWDDVVLCETLLKSISQISPSEIELREGYYNHMRGGFYLWEQNLDKAMEYHKRALDIFEKYDSINSMIPCILAVLGTIYTFKGELETALKYHMQSIKYYQTQFSNSIVGKWYTAISYDNLGYIYYQQGKLGMALEYHEKSLKMWEQLNSPIYVSGVYNRLINTLLAKNSIEQAKEYLNQFYQYNEKFKTFENISNYKLSKARILRSSTRTRDRAEAERELKKIIKWSDDLVQSGIPRAALGSSRAFVALCILYLVELKTTNDLTILEEIKPLIDRLVKEAERTNSYILQAQTYLLQGKISLLEMNMGDARRYLTQAQRIAEEHGLQLLAREISNEHDKLLGQLDKWEAFNKSNAPISDRMELASLEESVELIQQKRAIKPPELTDEEPLLLLIMALGGILLFSYPFSDEIKINDELFGGFLSAFTSISDEVLSEGLDRAKFGQYTVLMENIADFSFCYLFKGQTYLAKKKLANFTENFQKNTSMMQTLDKFNQTSQVIELKDFPFLEGFIKGIFVN
ncbi:MAG: tetratricopeptide repeat protein, partial [Candidatus Thorarchaeota archaeon]